MLCQRETRLSSIVCQWLLMSCIKSSEVYQTGNWLRQRWPTGLHNQYYGKYLTSLDPLRHSQVSQNTVTVQSAWTLELLRGSSVVGRLWLYLFLQAIPRNRLEFHDKVGSMFYSTVWGYEKPSAMHTAKDPHLKVSFGQHERRKEEVSAPLFQELHSSTGTTPGNSTCNTASEALMLPGNTKQH